MSKHGTSAKTAATRKERAPAVPCAGRVRPARFDHRADASSSRKAGVATLSDVFVQRRAELRLVAARIVRQGDCVEDILQDTYVRLVTGPRIDEIRNPFGYCCKAVRNTALDHLRRSTVEASVIASTQDGELPEVCDEREAYAGIDERRLLEHVETALEVFPERSRTMFRLHKVDGKTQREIGRLIGVSATLVNFTLQEVMEALAPLRDVCL